MGLSIFVWSSMVINEHNDNAMFRQWKNVCCFYWLLLNLSLSWIQGWHQINYQGWTHVFDNLDLKHNYHLWKKIAMMRRSDEGKILVVVVGTANAPSVMIQIHSLGYFLSLQSNTFFIVGSTNHAKLKVLFIQSLFIHQLCHFLIIFVVVSLFVII